MLIFLTLQVFSFSLPDFYHTTDDILSKIESLDCPSVKILENKTIHAIKFEESRSFKVFLLFGEHPRELITVELALKFIETLCNSNIQTFEALIVVNANPEGRRLVEQGDECRRTNADGVDLNRNWDSHWEQSDCLRSPDTCSGPFPFSESETEKMRDFFQLFNPDLFISVHSGAAALMYEPAYAFSTDSSESELGELLSKVKSSSKLDVEIGAASNLLNYTSAGTCLDFAFDHNATSFAFEIFLQNRLSGGKPQNQDFLKPASSECFEIFNPSSESSYSETLFKWSSALLSTINLVCC